MEDKEYQLLKDIELPTGRIYKGVRKSENNWMKIFPHLEFGDCAVKKDWFKEIPNLKYDKKDVIYFVQHCLNNNIDIDDVISEFDVFFEWY